MPTEGGLPTVLSETALSNAFLGRVVEVCLVTGMSWEIMQPLSGRTIMREFLDAHGEGIHHLAFDGDGAPWGQRVAEFTARGFAPTQSGRWLDQNAFAFFDTEAATTTCFETYHFPEDFVFPEPEEWYPGPPPPPTGAAAGT